ncbi:hypothetical protein BDW72DRAFT_59033 [Aspergillus terricola var. indicus]
MTASTIQLGNIPATPDRLFDLSQPGRSWEKDHGSSTEFELSSPLATLESLTSGWTFQWQARDKLSIVSGYSEAISNLHISPRVHHSHESGWRLLLLLAQAQASEESGGSSLAVSLQLSAPPSFSTRDQSYPAHIRPFWLPSTTEAFSRSSSSLGTTPLQVAARQHKASQGSDHRPIIRGAAETLDLNGGQQRHLPC